MSPLVMVARKENTKTGAIKLKSGELRHKRRIAKKTVNKRVPSAASPIPPSSAAISNRHKRSFLLWVGI